MTDSVSGWWIYVAGFTTPFVLAAVVVVLARTVRRSTATEIACDRCGWSTNPSASRLPWWVADNLRWSLHLFSRHHRAAKPLDAA